METRLGAFYDTIFGSIDFCRIMVYDEEKCIVLRGFFMAEKKVYFSKIELYTSSNQKIEYQDLEGLYDDILNRHSRQHGNYRTLCLNPKAEDGTPKLMMDVINYKTGYFFGRLSKQKENNALLKRDYETEEAEDVFTPLEAKKRGIEIFTYFLLNYSKGIFSIVSAQGAPKAAVLNNILIEYNDSYYTKFIDIPNGEGIEVLYNAYNPELTSMEIEVPNPSPVYLEEILEIKEDVMFDMLNEGTPKVYLMIKPFTRQSLERDSKKVKRIIEILKENKNKYTKAIISGKGAGLKNQKFDLHAKYFSYPITINKSHVEAGKRIEYSLEELTDQFSYGLYNAYQSNYNLIVALADREDNVY